jgi:hypothetical protein
MDSEPVAFRYALPSSFGSSEVVAGHALAAHIGNSVKSSLARSRLADPSQVALRCSIGKSA